MVGVLCMCARGGTRTHTAFRLRNFKSRVYTSFTTRAYTLFFEVASGIEPE